MCDLAFGMRLNYPLRFFAQIFVHGRPYSSAIFVGKLNLKRAGNVIALVHYKEKMKTKGWFSAQVRTRAEREA